MNEIYDFRQELNQPSKCLNKQDDLKELKTKLQYLEKENQSLKKENENKRKIIETALNQNNELFKLNHEIHNKNNVTHYQEKSIKECPKQDDLQVASKTSTKKSNNHWKRIWIIVTTIIVSFRLIVLEDCFMKIIIMMTMKA